MGATVFSFSTIFYLYTVLQTKHRATMAVKKRKGEEAITGKGGWGRRCHSTLSLGKKNRNKTKKHVQRPIFLKKLFFSLLYTLENGLTLEIRVPVIPTVGCLPPSLSLEEEKWTKKTKEETEEWRHPLPPLRNINPKVWKGEERERKKERKKEGRSGGKEAVAFGKIRTAALQASC